MEQQPPANPFAIQNMPQRGALTEVAVSRAGQEVQAAMVIAKKFPRDEVVAFDRVMRACKRKSLAEQAIYVYPRGGTSIQGPSIRLAEAVAQAWGNIEWGIKEIEQRIGESTVEAFAWDLETNARQVKIFTVPHVRYTKANGNTPLTDPREIYEATANYGARRLRACILGIIPGDVIEAAVDQCEQTMRGDGKEPLIDRVKKMALAFSDFGVSIAMLEKRLGHKLDATVEQELVNLRKIFISIKDGMAPREQFFEFIQDPSAPQGINPDEAAEAAAGLAPVQGGQQPEVGLGADKPKRGRKPNAPKTDAGDAVKAAGEAASTPSNVVGMAPEPTAPVQTPTPTPPVQQPTAKATDEPMTAKRKLRHMCLDADILEEDVVKLLKKQQLVPGDILFFNSIPEAVCADVIENWETFLLAVKPQQPAS